jgi:hypothetical protein
MNLNKESRFSPLEFSLTFRQEENIGDKEVWCGLMVEEVFEHAFTLFLKGDFILDLREEIEV